jgi:hypothetical protein
MKLKNLLNYLLENVDEGALRGFSLDILKKKMPEFKESAYSEDIGHQITRLVRYYGLPYMGSGSSRIVYALSTGKVLKIAINDKGIAQNEAEFEVSRDPSLKYIGARVYETDPDFHWSVMEVAKIYEDDTELKLDLGMPPVMAERFGYYITKAIDDIRAITDNIRTVDEVVSKYFDREPEDEEDEDEQKFREFLEDPPKGILALVDLTDSGLGGKKLEYGDIVTDHFGKTADGRPVLIDYGFTTGVMEDYYRDNSYNSSQYSLSSPPPSSIMSRDEEEDIEISRRGSERSDWGPLGPPSNRGEDDQERINRYMQRGRRGGGGSGEQV